MCRKATSRGAGRWRTVGGAGSQGIARVGHIMLAMLTEGKDLAPACAWGWVERRFNKRGKALPALPCSQGTPLALADLPSP